MAPTNSMKSKKFKKGDSLIVIAGKDKGRLGQLIGYAKKSRLIVEGINMVKKHVKANPNQGQQGGIVEKEMGIHISNVAIYNPETKKADRVGFKTLESGEKVRYYKSNGEVILEVKDH